MAVEIIITLETVGSGQGNLFDLYSNIDGFSIPYETDITLFDLQSGYTTNAPDGTSIVRVCGQEAVCTNCIDITPNYTTTTTTTTIPSTTTTTTTVLITTTTTTTSLSLIESAISSTTNATSACAETLDSIVWIDTGGDNISVSDIVYNSSSGVSVFNGNGEFYHINDVALGSTISARINASGEILTPISICT